MKNPHNSTNLDKTNGWTYNLGSLQIYNLSPFNAIQFEHSVEITLSNFTLSILHTSLIILKTFSLVVGKATLI